jgi:predicted NBD/HSP70 family sugar kinase
MLYGTNLEYTKAYNVRIVLETIRKLGPLSRADVARKTGLTAQTVSNITRRLLDAKLIDEADRIRTGRGAPATNLVINPDGAYSIGLDLDEEHLTGVLIDLEGNLRERVEYGVSNAEPDAAMDHMEQAAISLINQAGLDQKQIWGVGIGVPGPVEIWASVPLTETIHERLELPVFLENNATAAAIAERWYGEGRDIPTFFYLFFGLGLGGGLVIDGHPYDGHFGNAGEIGFTWAPFPDDGLRVFNDPHLGVYFNLPRLRRLLADQGILINRYEDLVDLLAVENSILMNWLKAGGERLAEIVPVITYVVDPEAVIFGGRLPDALIDVLMQIVGEALPKHVVRSKPFRLKLVRGRAGRDATALGVATLPMYEAFAPAHDILLKNSISIDDRLVERI